MLGREDRPLVFLRKHAAGVEHETRAAACAACSASGDTTFAGGASALYSLVRIFPPPYQGNPKSWPALAIRFISPGGWSSPMPSTWLSLDQSDLSFGLKSIPTGLRSPSA